MFKTIVLALDGSEGSERAIPFATALARRDGAEIVVVHVEEEVVGKGHGPMHGDPELLASLKERAKELTADGVETSVRATTVMLGGPAPAISRIADEVGADLIVAGTRGHSALAGVLLGSVTERLLHTARQPVFVVPPEARPPEEEDARAGAGAASAG